MENAGPSRCTQTRSQHPHSLLNPAADGHVKLLRKICGQLRFERFQCLIHPIGNIFDGMLHKCGWNVRFRACLQEVPGLYFADAIMMTFADRHGQFHVLVFDLACVEIGLRAHDVVEGRQGVSAAGAKEKAEVFGVSICCADQPGGQFGGAGS